MPTLVHPILFSQYFSVSSNEFENAGLIEPILNCDTKLFIDPTLIETSSNLYIRDIGAADLVARFRNIIKLVGASEKEGDLAWKGARSAT